MSCAETEIYNRVFTDILSQAITGELVGMANYAAMARLYPDHEGQCDAVAHAANEMGHARAFLRAGENAGLAPIVNLDAPYWKRIRASFLRRVDAGDLVGCLIIQEVMLESFAVSMYRAVAEQAKEPLARVFRAIGDEEQEHADHAVAELRGALSADRDAFESKVAGLHDDVMTTLAEMMATTDTHHCGLCKIGCIKESLGDVGLDRAAMRGLALNYYLHTLDQIGVRGERSLRWTAALPA